MLDFGAEVFQQARTFGVPILDVQYLFITHAHADHFYPNHLFWRWMAPCKVPPSEHDIYDGRSSSDLPVLQVYGNSDVFAAMASQMGREHAEAGFRMRLHQVEYGLQGQTGDITYLPLEANHHDRTCNAVNYVLQRDGRTILYALDTGWFFEHTYDLMKRFRYDLVVIEGTFGFGRDSPEHFNFSKLQRAIDCFREDNLLKEGARFCTSHICPHDSPVHDEYAPILAEQGITLAYDGMKVEL
jgi:phosphoribosyl 1,2-cyclic phosphate phosphodiesterase